MNVKITLNVNGRESSVSIDPERTLLDVLREDLHLTGTKYGCGEGQCGACTVLVDGKPTRSCVLQATAVENKSITTIEGLAREGALDPVQEAFLAEGAMQCGYCTPGMILTAKSLLAETPRPTEDEIIRWMNGNICRCSGYTKIIAAVQRAASA
jgi:aerobic-type carbon monoxide dehydrogenase small subunit (CoxS/CutS family)